ncbi:MAG: insulinase family protein [Phycisphaerae bacterium]|nr:insulinase family protein [Phycisphaerae bacterium]
MSIKETYHHRRLDCGLELGALPIEGRRTTTFEIRILAGLASESDDKLGVARLVEETIGKGTEDKTARELTDAFDAIGAQCSSGVGRESVAFRCNCLPEYVEKALALHAEMLRQPTFPKEFCQVAVDLARQELIALEDDPGELSRKLLAPYAYGPQLGRHDLGTAESLDRMTRDDIVSYWRRHFGASRMLVATAGVVDVDRTVATLERLFAGFGEGDEDGRDGFPVKFSPGVRHHDKKLEQEHILMCWPGVKVTDDDYPVERLMLAVLGDGMSSRLFTEVREKQGLVYWVGAWDEHPRNAGMIFLGASTKPARCDQTVETLLHEVDRLGEDVAEEELERAKVGIIAKTQTHGDITRSRASELSGDLFHYGRPVPLAEKNEWISRVTIADVRRYLAEHSREERCVLTLGPKGLAIGD